MLALHPSLVASGAAAGDVPNGGNGDDESARAWYCASVACVSLLLFVVLTAGISVSRAGAVAGAVVLLLLLFGWFAPSAAPPTGRGAPATRQPARRLAHHRCVCGLSDAALGTLPSFAYEPPGAGGAKDSGGDDDDGSAVLCAVCLEDVRAGEMVRQLPACRHLFHVDCVDAWLRAHRTCPVCRRELSPQSATAKQAAAADELPPV